MATFPVTASPPKITALFEKIRRTGVPSKVDQDWLKAMGFTSSRDRSMVGMLKSLGYLDSTGSPTERWRSWKDVKEGPKVLGEAVREGFRGIFETYPDAQDATDKDLRNLINTVTGTGEDMVGQYLSTFKGLCKLVDWSAASKGQGEEAAYTSDAAVPQHINMGAKPISRGNTNSNNGLVVNLNIQLSLPETLDQAGYEAFFAAMKKHLFPEPTDG